MTKNTFLKQIILYFVNGSYMCLLFYNKKILDRYFLFTRTLPSLRNLLVSFNLFINSL